MHVQPHPVFGRKGDNLTLTVPVTFPEAALGGEVKVPTLGGPPVTLKIPAGTANGRTFRVRGKGAARKDGTRGDLLVTVEVAVPEKLDGKARDALEAYREATTAERPAGRAARGSRGRGDGRHGPPHGPTRSASHRCRLPGGGTRCGRPRGSSTTTEDPPVYVISVAAELAGLHPQTLRQYDRLGLVSPGRRRARPPLLRARHRAAARGAAAVADEGVNLDGIKRILELENQVDALQARVAELQAEAASAGAAATQREAAVHACYRRDLVPYQQVQQSSALVVWRPKRRGE